MAGGANPSSEAQPLGLSFPSAMCSGELGPSHTILLSLSFLMCEGGHVFCPGN